MIDTDLLLLPTLAHYFLEIPQGANRSASFLARNATLQEGSYSSILQRNIDYVYGRALPFAANSTYSNLLSLRLDQPVGNWRDSNAGLGYGQYPFDVNTALVPAALRAIASLGSAGVVSNTSTANATQVAEIWEQRAPPLFATEVDSVRRRSCGRS